jgi:hypothetical protein
VDTIEIKIYEMKGSWPAQFIHKICNFTKRSPHSILSQFLDGGFSGCRAQNWAYVLPCPTKSTDSSAIYKLTIGLADY